MKEIIRGVLLTLNIMAAACAREPSCPVCSRYDYEERILERVLSNEIDMIHMVNEIRETNAKVEAALKVLQEDRTELATALTILTQTQDEMKLNLDNAIDGAVSNMSKAVAQMKASTTWAITLMEKENKNLKDQLVVPMIFVYARSQTSSYVQDGQTVIYTADKVNEGHGYNPTTGRFTVSVPGMYAFAVQCCI